jgi:hypothetical protein
MDLLDPEDALAARRWAAGLLLSGFAGPAWAPRPDETAIESPETRALASAAARRRTYTHARFYEKQRG